MVVVSLDWGLWLHFCSLNLPQPEPCSTRLPSKAFKCYLFRLLLKWTEFSRIFTFVYIFNLEIAALKPESADCHSFKLPLYHCFGPLLDKVKTGISLFHGQSNLVRALY